MITGLESFGNMQTPLNTVLENLADTIADKVIAKIKAEAEVLYAQGIV